MSFFQLFDIQDLLYPIIAFDYIYFRIYHVISGLFLLLLH